MNGVSVTVSVDTEEDDWGSFAQSGATSLNIERLPELQDLLARWDARPTYLVNRAPLLATPAVAVLGRLAETPGVEIGGHCHPWNTPPWTGAGADRSMMCALPLEANRGKISEVTRRIEDELGVRPRSFRAGRWGFGPTVSEALAAEGYLVDASVSPFIDWTPDGGPDYSTAANRPYRFHPATPFESDPAGDMVEVPTTVGFLGGRHRARASLRRAIERTPLRRLKLIAVLERLGIVQRRWLSPETSTMEEMLRLAEACLRSGEPVLDLTFHSCTLEPGLTPFVRDEHDRTRFLAALDGVLRFCSEAGLRFRTFREVGEAVMRPAGAANVG